MEDLYPDALMLQCYNHNSIVLKPTFQEFMFFLLFLLAGKLKVVVEFSSEMEGKPPLHHPTVTFHWDYHVRIWKINQF